MKKLIPYILLVLIMAAIAGYNIVNKSHLETHKAASDIVISPKELLDIYEADEESADAKFLDKIIEVKGIVKEINNVAEGGSISLNTGNDLSSIICEFESSADFARVKVGDEVTIKGFCSGKLMDIVLVRCSLQFL